MFNHFLHVILNNAKVLFNDHMGEGHKMTLLKFQQSVVEHLCNAGRGEAMEVVEEAEEEEEAPPVLIVVGNRKQRWEADFVFRNTGKHAPCIVAKKQRKLCVICGRKITMTCLKCDVFVCCAPSDCWSLFHDTEKPWGA